MTPAHPEPVKGRDVLGPILSAVRKRLAARRKIRPLAVIRKMALAVRPADFLKAIRGKSRLAVIAELKRSSPSSPNLSPRLDPLSFARKYNAAGASAISVLTEEDHFGGSLDDLWIVSHGVKLPVLRKDFMVDDYQIYEARAFGAAAILLIVRALDRSDLVRFHRIAGKLGLAALVEVHDERELEMALTIGATLIGVNNRNLSTLKTDLSVSARLLPLIPKSKVSVAESGYSKISELTALRGLADAVLIGTAFLKNPARLRTLL